MEAQLYLDMLIVKKYWVILLNDEGTEYNLTPLGYIVDHWEWVIYEDNMNNANAIQFHGDWKTIKRSSGEKGNLFEPPLWQQFEDLLL
jgi:hypothetical protein